MPWVFQMLVRGCQLAKGLSYRQTRSGGLGSRTRAAGLEILDQGYRKEIVSALVATVRKPQIGSVARSNHVCSQWIDCGSLQVCV